MLSIRAAYAPPFVTLRVDPRRRRRAPRSTVGESRLARSLAAEYGGDGDAQLARLMRISADDEDDRSMDALRVLLHSMRGLR